MYLMCMCLVKVIRMENGSGVPSSNYERELCINALGTDTNLPLGQNWILLHSLREGKLGIRSIAVTALVFELIKFQDT